MNLLILMQGYVDFGRFDTFNYFVSGSGHVDFVQVSFPFFFWVENDTTVWFLSCNRKMQLSYLSLFLNVYRGFIMATWRNVSTVMINWDEQLRLFYAGKLPPSRTLISFSWKFSYIYILNIWQSLSFHFSHNSFFIFFKFR